MRAHHLILVGGLVAGLIGTTGNRVVAAKEEGGADLEKAIEQLQAENPGVSKEDAEQVLRLAEKDLQGPVARELPGGKGEQAGGIVQGLGGREITPEGQTLMKEANELGQALHDKGYTPEQIHEEIEKQFGDRFREGAERMEREMKEHGFTPEREKEMRDLMEKEHPTMEAPERQQEQRRDYQPPR